MQGFDIDKSEYTQYIDIDNRWYEPISELLRKNTKSEELDESSLVKEIKKNEIEIRWNKQWKGLNEIKNVKKFYIIYGTSSKSLTHMMEPELTLVGALANISYCEYYSKGILKEKSKLTENITCLYALVKDMNTLIISFDDRSLPPQKSYLLCDLLFQELSLNVKITIINTDLPLESVLAKSKKIEIPKTSYNIFYIKSKKASIPYDNKFSLLPINYLVTGFSAAALTYCQIYNIDCILFQYIWNLDNENIPLRSDYFYEFLSLLNPIFKEINLNSIPFSSICELTSPQNQMFL